MLPAETLKIIQDTAQRAQKLELIPSPFDSRAAYLRLEDRYESIDVPPPLRNHFVCSLDDLVEYAKPLAGARLTGPDAADEPQGRLPELAGTGPVIWHSPQAVILILDDADRRDRVTFGLTFSQPFILLVGIAQNPAPMSQREFVRMLKISLRVPEPLVGPWRALNWSVISEAMGEVTAGVDRMGKQVNARVAGTSALPNDLTVHVSVYNEPGERRQYPIQCDIEMDPASQRLLLIPQEGELQDAIQLSQADIRDRIIGRLACPVFFGSP